MKRSMLIAMGLAAGLTGCATREATPDVYANPQAYLGKTVKVCGLIHNRFEDTEIWPDARTQQADGVSLGFIGAVGNKWDGRQTCVSARIVWVGCKSDTDKVCLSMGSDYAALVDAGGNIPVLGKD